MFPVSEFSLLTRYLCRVSEISTPTPSGAFSRGDPRAPSLVILQSQRKWSPALPAAEGPCTRHGSSAARREVDLAPYSTVSSVGRAHPEEVNASRAEERGGFPSSPRPPCHLPGSARALADVGRFGGWTRVPPAEPDLHRRQVPPGFLRAERTPESGHCSESLSVKWG